MFLINNCNRTSSKDNEVKVSRYNLALQIELYVCFLMEALLQVKSLYQQAQEFQCQRILKNSIKCLHLQKQSLMQLESDYLLSSYNILHKIIGKVVKLITYLN